MGQKGQIVDDDNYVTNEDLPLTPAAFDVILWPRFYFLAAALTVSQDGDII